MADEWRYDFARFYADMGPRPLGTSIDRVDNDRGYEPGNCRWATPAQQVANRRCTIFVEHEGERIPLKVYCSITGLNYSAVVQRVRRTGLDPKVAADLVKAHAERRRALNS